MELEYLKLQINNLMDVRKNLWTAIIVLTGGLSGLLLTVNNFSLNYITITKIVLLILGALTNYFFLKNLSACNSDLTKLFIKAEEKK
jgi:hypothetical protein